MNTKDLRQSIIENPKGKLLAVDIDGTLCTGEARTEEQVKNAKPRKEVIELINTLYCQGAHIVVYTARSNLLYTLTQNRLVENNVRHHGIAMGRKPGADCYIDDKSVNVDDLYPNQTDGKTDAQGL